MAIGMYSLVLGGYQGQVQVQVSDTRPGEYQFG